MTNIVKIKAPGETQTYQIWIGAGLLEKSGEWAKHCLAAGGNKIAIVSNKKVFGLYGSVVKKSFEKAGYKVSVWLMQDGEQHKNFGSLEELLAFLSEEKFTRADAVASLGGGVAGDLAGFAASVYLRGIAMLQIPTTLVSQVDSSVGGKTAINTAYGKNLIGAFYQPKGVLIDIDTLQTLPRRELTSGFCEVVKQGAVSGRGLFNKTREFLKNYPVRNFSGYFTAAQSKNFKADLAGLIKAQVAFKARIVAGDEKESLSRADNRSRKILNFGHTIGHALEKTTHYQQLKHGEAVGYGMIAAAEISKNLGIFDKNSLKSLIDVIALAGRLPRLKNITPEEVFRAAAFDKKKAGRVTTWILLKKIGEPVLIGDDKIQTSMIKKSIKAILK
jgi:3-dehydroquinate synthase